MNPSERKYHAARIPNDEASCLYGRRAHMVLWDIDCFHGWKELHFGGNDSPQQRWPRAVRPPCFYWMCDSDNQQTIIASALTPDLSPPRRVVECGENSLAFSFSPFTHTHLKVKLQPTTAHSHSLLSSMCGLADRCVCVGGWV